MVLCYRCGLLVVYGMMYVWGFCRLEFALKKESSVLGLHCFMR